MKKLSVLMAIIFLVTCFLGKTYYDSKIKADVQGAQHKGKAEKQEEENSLKKQISKVKTDVSSQISADAKKEFNLVPFQTKAFEKLENGQASTIVFLGDSTTEQNSQTNGKPGHVSIINDLLKNTFGSETINVVNAGVSGNTIVDMSNRIENVINANPDLVVINSGINDVGKKVSNAIFEEKYKSIIEQIQNKTQAQIIIRTSNVTKDDWVNKRLEKEINPIVQRLATDYKTGFVDLYSYYNYQIKNNNMELDSINNDNIHPNEKGQQIISDLMLYSLMGEN
ncbi:SGNH/GDSL hydrolase family protein [Bacillus sp. RIT694]|uniref:SGNH/GDSL hydrolase family protein n=1 Tax=Bacillus sp. RIT694 TaxID=2666190 RepID=UPI0012ACDEC9|nr:SGNH/GDSL hydrolase family protein [Bacillus sp. RIT694]MRS25917.1 SGNH/GDSL hydrolase family protein [Bacillus sp. RIT694]